MSRAGRRKRRDRPRGSTPVTATAPMDFAPITGFIQNKNTAQDFNGWRIFASRPSLQSTEVVLMTKATYDSLRGNDG